MDISTIVIIVVSILFSAFFSGMEIAFITSNKLRIELENKQGKFTAGIISRFFLANPSRFIGTMLVGNNIALVIYGIYMAILLDPVFNNLLNYNDAYVLVAQTIVSTILILFTAEYLPKAFFRLHANSFLSVFALPALLIYFLLYPVVLFTIGLSEFILGKVFGFTLPEGRIDFTRIDLDNFLKEATEGNQTTEEELDHEIQIFQNALDFGNLKARDCMIPRTEIIGTDVRETIDNLRNKFIETGLSKILIYRDTIDHIIGYVHLFELYKQPADVPSVLRPVLIIPETMAAQDVLSQFIQGRKSLAVVVDEFGGTSGILTMEDVIEEIFGEIEDEHDVEEFIEERIRENEFIFSGRLEVDYLNQEYNIGLPEGDYDTLAGLIIDSHGSIPVLNERIFIDPFQFDIVGVSDKRIEKVKVKKIED